MTRSTIEKYRCSKCGRIHDFTCWHEINISENPELHEDVLKGRIFDAVCPDCKTSNFIQYPLLYQDEQRNFLLFLTDSPSRENPLKPVYDFLKKSDDEESRHTLQQLHSLKVRLVHTPNQLSEKILIFEHGLDDRILEMMKVLMRGEIARQKPDLQVKALYYSPAPGRAADTFSIETDEGFGQAVDVYKDLYDGLRDEVMPHLTKKQLESTSIDEDWAFEAMGYRQKDEKASKMN